VPSSLHKPISQQAILLKTGLNNIAANQFLKYLKGPASIKIIKSYGYRFLEDE
jgi:molybdate transport system substrate-binding protein